MSRRTHGNLILLMLAAGVFAGLVEYCTTWTRQQQERNPVGYISWLIRDLEGDLQSLRTVRGQMQRELQRVCEEQQRIEQRCRAAAEAAAAARQCSQAEANGEMAGIRQEISKNRAANIVVLLKE